MILTENTQYIKEKISELNKPFVFDILNLIYESPKKGITTYVSILQGEDNAKILNSGYDKFKSYGSMSGHSKKYIKDSIEYFIKQYVILNLTMKIAEIINMI